MTAPLVPAVNTANVITGMGAMFYQPYVLATPPVRPADTVALGTAWPTPWIPIGATHEGITMGFTRESTGISIEEVPNEIDVRTASSTLTFTMTLAEDTVEHMALAFGGGTITTVAAGTGIWGYKDFVISDEMAQYGIGLEGRNKFGYPRRVVVPIAKSISEIESAMRRTEKHMYNVTIRALSPLNQCVFHEITTPPV